MSRDDGGPAFPFEGGNNNGMQPYHGMALRDYFAAKASDGDVRHYMTLSSNAAVTRQQARYMHADHMLLERAKCL